jgi:hypothetical protein
MTNINKRLDHVISKVHKDLVNKQFLIPVKTDEGILVGSVLIKSREALKDLYQNGELIYGGVSLNKIAIKVANCQAINPGLYRDKIQKMIEADTKFGQALEDYQLFKDKYQKARQAQDQFRIDLFLARMCYAKDSANYWKSQAELLAR